MPSRINSILSMVEGDDILVVLSVLTARATIVFLIMYYCDVLDFFSVHHHFFRSDESLVPWDGASLTSSTTATSTHAQRFWKNISTPDPCPGPQFNIW